MVDFRWWTLEELQKTSERVYPRGLAGMLGRVLAEGPPRDPVRIKG